MTIRRLAEGAASVFIALPLLVALDAGAVEQPADCARRNEAIAKAASVAKERKMVGLRFEKARVGERSAEWLIDVPDSVERQVGGEYTFLVTKKRCTVQIYVGD